VTLSLTKIRALLENYYDRHSESEVPPLNPQQAWTIDLCAWNYSNTGSSPTAEQLSFLGLPLNLCYIFSNQGICLLSVCLRACLLDFLPVCLSFCLSNSQTVCPNPTLSVCMYASSFLFLLSVSLSASRIFLCICLSFCISLHFFQQVSQFTITETIDVSLPCTYYICTVSNYYYITIKRWRLFNIFHEAVF
jgi:hypothetical protein